jgi:hypothetical protein
MTGRLRTYWFEFDLAQGDDWPRGTRIGAGVTAFDMDDARTLLGSDVFTGGPIPPIVKVVEDVDPRTLDPWSVLANMHPPTVRGLWFPAMSREPTGRGLVARVLELLSHRGGASRYDPRSGRAERRGVSGGRQ